MSHYRRNHDGQTYFFTVVIDRRRPILTTDVARSALREAIQTVREELPFKIVAFVLLPDHLHAVWELPKRDKDYSTRWQGIKASFTKDWKRSGGSLVPVSESRANHGEQGVWQRRFF